MRLDTGWEVRSIPLHADPLPHSQIQTGWLPVPGCTHLQPFLYPDRAYWGAHLRDMNTRSWLYRYEFILPSLDYGRVRVRFEGVDYFASVWLNDNFLGDHEGHFEPFDFDITTTLRQVGINTLLVRVCSPWDPPNPGGMPPMNHVSRQLVKGTYEHGDGIIPPDVNPVGIWRPVWLLFDQGVSVDKLRIRTDNAGQVVVQTWITNATSQSLEGYLNLNVTAENHDGPGAEAVVHVVLPPGETQVEQILVIPDPRLWWPWDHGAPNLYRLTAQLHSGPVSAQKTETFGLRTVHLERTPDRFTYWINDRPVFVRGTSYMPGLYFSQQTAQTLARDVEWARAAHLNLLRAHVHVSPPEFYDCCDRTGMLVWQDFELNWIHDSSPDFEARSLRLQRAMIDMLDHHPAIITWACHNEPTMIFTRRENLEVRPDPALYADALRQDPTRPVFICSGQMEDDWQRSGDLHAYYGALWSPRYTDVYSHRPRLPTEFGFEAPANPAALRAVPEVWTRVAHLADQTAALWDYQARLIQFHVEHFRRLRAQSCGGYIHFWLADLVPQVGAGVLDASRCPKGGYEALKLASQPLHVALENDGRRPHGLWVFNDTPQAYPQSTVVWRAFDSAGHALGGDRISMDVNANAAQQVTPWRWPLPLSECHGLELELHTVNGVVSNYYTRPFQPLPRPVGYPWKFDAELGMKVFDRAGAVSMTDRNVHPVVRLIPVSIREHLTEWVLRQRLPVGVLSSAARLLDWLSSAF